MVDRFSYGVNVERVRVSVALCS